MAEYDVILEREVTEEGYITVDADSADEAKKKAEAAMGSEIAWDRVDTGRHWSVSTETCEVDLTAKVEALDGSDTRLLNDLRAGGHPIVFEGTKVSRQDADRLKDS